MLITRFCRKMCTVLQQHLSSDYDKDSSQGDSSITRSGTPSTSIFHHQRTSCVSQPTYSYLQDPSGLKRPGETVKASHFYELLESKSFFKSVDVYDRKISAPAKLAHFHVPVDSGGVRDSGRSRSSYIQHLLGRRARLWFKRTNFKSQVVFKLFDLQVVFKNWNESHGRRVTNFI